MLRCVVTSVRSCPKHESVIEFNMSPEAARMKAEWQSAQRKLRDDGHDCAFVYAHFRESDGQPFYVGIGTYFDRPWQYDTRNELHKRIRKKHGLIASIIASGLSWPQACFWEERWINALRVAGYPIANMTNGGDGNPWYGEENPSAKLTEQQVVSILKSTDSHTREANKHGVSPTAVRDIRVGNTWINLYRSTDKAERYDNDTYVIPDQTVINVLESPISNAEAARAFGVNPATVRAIRSGKIRRDLRAVANIPAHYNHGTIKLSDVQVREILASSCSNPELAAKFGVHRDHIRNIRRGIRRRKGGA